jgi:hypothetical protein
MFNRLNNVKDWLNSKAKYIVQTLFLSTPPITVALSLTDTQNKTIEESAVVENLVLMWFWAMIQNMAQYLKIYNIPVEMQASISDSQLAMLKRSAYAVIAFSITTLTHFILLASGEIPIDTANVLASLFLNEGLFICSVKFHRDCYDIFKTVSTKKDMLLSNQSLKRKIPNIVKPILELTTLLLILPIMFATTEQKEDSSRVIPANMALVVGFVYFSVCALKGEMIDKLNPEQLPRMKLLLQEVLLLCHGGLTIGLAIDQLVETGTISAAEKISLIAVGESFIIHAKMWQINLKAIMNSQITMMNNPYRNQSLNRNTYPEDQEEKEENNDQNMGIGANMNIVNSANQLIDTIDVAEKMVKNDQIQSSTLS